MLVQMPASRMKPNRGQRGQRHFQFFANFFGRPQQLGSFFNQKNIGNVSAPFGLMSYLIVVRVAEADGEKGSE